MFQPAHHATRSLVYGQGSPVSCRDTFFSLQAFRYDGASCLFPAHLLSPLLHAPNESAAHGGTQASHTCNDTYSHSQATPVIARVNSLSLLFQMSRKDIKFLSLRKCLPAMCLFRPRQRKQAVSWQVMDHGHAIGRGSSKRVTANKGGKVSIALPMMTILAGRA